MTTTVAKASDSVRQPTEAPTEKGKTRERREESRPRDDRRDRNECEGKHRGGHTDRWRARSEHEADDAKPTITKRQRDGTEGRRSRSVGGDAHSARSREKLWGKRNLVSNLLYYSLYTEPRTYYGLKGTSGCARETGPEQSIPRTVLRERQGTTKHP